MHRDPESPPSEMLTQMLFAMYAHEYALSLGKRFVIFSPTQPQEAALGYDAALRNRACRELYLQFKRAEPAKQNPTQELRYTIDNRPPTQPQGQLGQLDTLQKHYPKGSAFYVCGCFQNVAHTLEMQDATPRAGMLLNIYTALSAHEIRVAKQSRTICIQYRPPLSDKLARIHPARGTDYVHAAQWFYGAELLLQFLAADTQTARVGCTIGTRNGRFVRVPNQAALQQRAEPTPIPSADANLQDEYSLQRLTIRVFDEEQA
jgi:hypothetical protein